MPPFVDIGKEPGRLESAQKKPGMTQAQLACTIGLSQSRVAKAERTADGVGLDLLMRAFFATGCEVADLAKI